MIRSYSRKNSKSTKKEKPKEDEDSIPPTGSKTKMFMEIKRMIDIRNKQYFEDKEEADEILGDKKESNETESLMKNENLYLSQAHHYLRHGLPEKSLKCINSTLGKTKYEANEESMLIAARSRYNLSLHRWRRAVQDANIAINDNTMISQAFCSKVEGLFNLCCFEEALVTSKRGQQKFKNDKRFEEWSKKCTQVLLETLHKCVFDDIYIQNLNDETIRFVFKKRPKIKAKKNLALDRLKDDTAYLENICETIQRTNLPETEEFKLRTEPETILQARQQGEDLSMTLEETIGQLRLREQFWYCFK